nr:hypothetical protein [Tanacetum cinerariifolium]
MLRELKTLFAQQAEHELLQTMRDFHSCRQEEGQSVSSYVLKMKGYIDNLERLGHPVTLGLGGTESWKEKNNQAYAPKPKIPPLPKKEDLAKDSICHECGETGHWKRNCPQYLAELLKKKKNAASGAGGLGLRASSKLKSGALSLYVSNGQRKAVEAIGIFNLCLLSGLEIVLNNCHYALSITRGIISVSRLYEDGFVNRFVNNTIQVSRNNMVYFSAISRDGIFEIDLSNSYTNESSIYAVSNKRAKLDLDSALLWHCRLGHISKKRIEKLQHDGLLDSSDLRAFEKIPKGTMGYSFYNPPKNKVLVARDAKFLENNLINQEASESLEDFEIIQEEDTHPSIDTCLNHEDDDLEIDEPQSDIVLIRRDLGEPTNYKVALLDPESKKWLNAMNVKMQSMKDNEVWVLVGLPPNGKTVASKWLFKKKTDIDGNVHTYKARFVAKGYTQTPGIDYEETFSSVADIRAIRILIAIEKHKLSKSQGASTPAELKRMQNIPYASAVGSIMYAVRCTRPDVAFAQNVTSRFQQNPGDLHWTTVKNILKYLRNTKDMFLVYGGDLKRELMVFFYTDAGYLTDVDDLKSQTGYVFILNGGAVDWKSAKQSIFATSSVEAEEFISRLGVVPTIEEPITQNVWIKGSKEIVGLMLMNMEPEMQRNLKPLHAHEMLRELKTMFAQQAEQELLQTTRDFHSCMQEEWRMRKTVNELHAMLKLHEQTLPKTNALAIHVIRAGKVEKGNKPKKLQSQTAARGQNRGKGKNKKAYAPKPKIPLYLKGKIPQRTQSVMSVGLRASRKLKPGALSLYVSNGQREAVDAIGVFNLCLPSGLEIILNNCHYAPSITRGVISVSRLYEDGFVNRFVNNTIQVSRNKMFYFSAIPRDGIFEIDLSNSYTNESSIYAVSNKRAKLDLDSALLWHCRLRHISKKRNEKLQHDGLLDSSDLRDFEKFVSCMSGKMTRKPYTHQVERAKDLLGLIHTDVYGPF